MSKSPSIFAATVPKEAPLPTAEVGGRAAGIAERLRQCCLAHKDRLQMLQILMRVEVIRVVGGGGRILGQPPVSV